MFGFGRGDPLGEINLLELRPVRLAEWEEREDGVLVLIRPRPRGRGLRVALERLMSHAATQRIRMDHVGKVAWLALDGARTVGDVAALLRERFGASAEPAEERLGTLVQMLRREGFLGYPGYDVVD